MLRYITQAKEKGIGGVFVTHNPYHAYPIGDRFVVLRRGKVVTDCAKEQLSLEQLVRLMAGGPTSPTEAGP